MKKIITLTMLLVAFTGFAQIVQGEITIKEQSKMELTAKSNKAVNLFADFRENKFPIHFVFTASDVPLNIDKKEVVQFVFSTTVKKDGKTIGTIKRSPMPFFPGNMFIPIETFDVISVLSNIQTNTPETVSEIPKGNYEIILEAKPIGVKGQITSTTLFLKVN